MKKIELYDKYGNLNTGMELVHKGTELMKEITSMGYSTYIVGGCVRDLLMGKTPHDIDIATNMPIDVIKQHYNTIEYGGGERHGTVIVHHQGEDYELTQFRSESTYSDNRRPDEVVFVDSFKEDSLRRDFTINAMGIDCDGNVIDYHGGLDDIERKIIRTVGSPEDRFAEDSLRILRAARFASRLKFEIDIDTRNAMTKLADTVNNVSDERIRDEFCKSMNQHYSFGVFIRYLNELQILHKVFPQVKSHVIPSICRADSTDKILNFALLFQPKYISITENNAISRLKLTNEELKVYQYCTHNESLMRVIGDGTQHESKVKMVMHPSIHYLMKYYKAIYREDVNQGHILHYRVMNEVYDLDKEVNLYISSLGITGKKFGHTVSYYREWVFAYYHKHLTLPLSIEWQNKINDFINSPSTKLFWENI